MQSDRAFSVQARRRGHPWTSLPWWQRGIGAPRGKGPTNPPGTASTVAPVPSRPFPRPRGLADEPRPHPGPVSGAWRRANLRHGDPVTALVPRPAAPPAGSPKAPCVSCTFPMLGSEPSELKCQLHGPARVLGRRSLHRRGDTGHHSLRLLVHGKAVAATRARRGPVIGGWGRWIVRTACWAIHRDSFRQRSSDRRPSRRSSSTS